MKRSHSHLVPAAEHSRGFSPGSSLSSACVACALTIAATAPSSGRAQPAGSIQSSNAPALEYPSLPPAILTTNAPPSSVGAVTNLLWAAPAPLPATGIPGVPPGQRFGGTSQLASGPRGGAGALPTSSSPFRWGPVLLRPHIDYQLTYGNSLQPLPGQQVNSFVHALSPGILAQLGSHWTVDYTPTLRFYSDSHFQDGTDHAVSLSGGTTYEDWSLSLFQGYVSSSQPLIETAAQTSQETYSTSLGASRPFGNRLSLDLGISQNFLFLDQTIPTEALSDRRSWSTMDWLNYQLLPKLSAGLGVGFSYDNMDVGPDITTEQYQGRLIWTPGTKLNVVFSGGLSDMQFLGSGSSDLLSPVFSLSAQYQLFEPTTLFVGASRAVSPSYFQSQVSESTGVNAGLNQRLLGWLYLNASGGYANSTYHASATGPVAASVSDYDTASFNVALSASFLTRASASVFFSQNYVTSSGSGAYNYTTTQSGLELSYRY